MPSVSSLLSDAVTRAGLSQDQAVLLEWMNQEYRDTNMEIAKSEPDYFLTTTTLQLVSGTTTYNLAADYLRGLVIEDENGVAVPKISRLDPSYPRGWCFFGYTIAGGVRYERIRIQESGGAAVTTSPLWTIHYVQNPPDLDAITNTTPAWPLAIHELLTMGLLMRWMEQDEQPDRYVQYKGQRDAKRGHLFDLISDRTAGQNESILVTHPEDFS